MAYPAVERRSRKISLISTVTSIRTLSHATPNHDYLHLLQGGGQTFCQIDYTALWGSDGTPDQTDSGSFGLRIKRHFGWNGTPDQTAKPTIETKRANDQSWGNRLTFSLSRSVGSGMECDRQEWYQPINRSTSLDRTEGPTVPRTWGRRHISSHTDTYVYCTSMNLDHVRSK